MSDEVRKKYLNQYEIININGIFEDLYGETVIVEANPLIQNTWGGIFVGMGRNKDTKYFIIPKSMVDTLIPIAQSGKYWSPNMTDFKREKIFNEDWHKIMTVFRHKHLSMSTYEDLQKKKALPVEMLASIVIDHAQSNETEKEIETLECLYDKVQGTTWCLRTKAFLCSHHVAHDSPEGKFSLMMKTYMEEYRSNETNKRNAAMKWLYESTDLEILVQQISMLAMHAQFKDCQDINNVEKKIEVRSLDPESVSVAIALYTYFTILINNSLDALSYNELFIKSWYSYYDNWMCRRLMFQMNGNSWKKNFKGVLLE